ncbi:hypothetical protein SUGI_0906010 [Cryptomeria japonica]|nr:hypothetical protein SUGI_0906010 [Cryptomeria japonica]
MNRFNFKQEVTTFRAFYWIGVLLFSTLLFLACYGGSSSFIELPVADHDGLYRGVAFRDFQQNYRIGGRRFLSGPGSSPPRCISKCGKCTPCKPVHVPVPPGTPVTEEYYPEAWRCKCGNKLYMP